MAITRESVEAKLVELRKQYQQIMDNGNAVGGAIQICEQMLTEDEAPPAEPIDVNNLTWIGPGPDPRQPILKEV